MTQLNYFDYDDESYAYVYAHTHRDVNRLMNDIVRISATDGAAFEEPIAVTAEEYWPLPWYLRDYKHVGYYAGTKIARERILLCAEAQQPEIEARLGSGYERIDSYILRPGLRLVLYKSSLGERLQAGR
jgi:predicted membrane-bound mannosyltransferase